MTDLQQRFDVVNAEWQKAWDKLVAKCEKLEAALQEIAHGRTPEGWAIDAQATACAALETKGDDRG